ncbi:MAG: squalene synthase HpnD [Acidimicrobiales bacterium]|nr:MAG: squalene synthase HpnD [Acidimicrobiales bacterium]
MSVTTAYADCEAITRAQAKNFYYGIRLLPPPKRHALSAIYAMARRIDDIGDGDLSTKDKLDHLDEVRRQLADPGAVVGHDPVMMAVADAAQRYPVPMAAFGELVEGCEMDAAGTSYETFEDLVGYGRRVAGSIGRLSLGVFGATDMALASSRADALGVALQVTNILRDVVEDREEMGRVYLPIQDIARFGVAPDLTGPRDNLAALIVFEAEQSRPFWSEGLALLPLLDHRSRACVAAMAGIYHRLLARIERRPTAVAEVRVSLPGWEKAWVATRAITGLGITNGVGA